MPLRAQCVGAVRGWPHAAHTALVPHTCERSATAHRWPLFRMLLLLLLLLLADSQASGPNNYQQRERAAPIIIKR